MIDDRLLMVPPPFRRFCACALGTPGTSCMRRPRVRARRSRQGHGGSRRERGPPDDGDGPPPSGKPLSGRRP
jgi:hypothetical protein